MILQIIRKVEKQSVVLDADENISQLHKVGTNKTIEILISTIEICLIFDTIVCSIIATIGCCLYRMRGTFGGH